MLGNYDGVVKISTALDNGGFQSGLKGLKTQLGGLSTVIGKFGKAMIAAKVTKVLFDLGKQAVSAASDLQEVQNVADTAFGSMKNKVEEFASTAIDQFGMSELSAKRTASTYMAMAKGLGIADQTASDMSISLAGLSGDVASFFNITQGEADTKLKSVFTGETETLKDLGVVMTQANLQQYAYSRGIQTNIADMTQAQQVMLRYQFVTDNLSIAQGDFAKTSGSWANQTRILSERWNQFLGILGEGLVTVLLPVVKFLNDVLEVLIGIGEAIGWVLTNVFGVESAFDKVDTSNGDLSDSADDATDSELGLAGGIEEAGKQAKKALAPFDELNILQGQLANSSVETPNFDIPSLPKDPGSKPNDGNKKKFEVEVIPKWGGTLPPLEALGVEVVPELTPLPNPVYQPNWGLEPPPIPVPDLAPLPSPVYLPEWNLQESLVPELASIKDSILDFAPVLQRAFQTALAPALAYAVEVCVENVPSMEQVFAEAKENILQNVGQMSTTVQNDFAAMTAGSLLAVGAYASGISTAMYETAKNVDVNTGQMVSNAYENIIQFVNSSVQAFASWGNGVLDSVYQTAVSMRDSFLSGLQSMWSSFVSFTKGIGEDVASFFHENKGTIIKGVIAAAAVAGIGALVVTSGGLAAPLASGAGAAALAAIPALATGAVIPPNNEFLAVLGDQKNGTNIEAPEGLIRQIIREELGRTGGGAQRMELVVKPMPGFTRYLSYELDEANQNRGVKLVKGAVGG